MTIDTDTPVEPPKHLTKWYAGWCERRRQWLAERRAASGESAAASLREHYIEERGLCVECGERAISGGSSVPCQRAWERGMCLGCSAKEGSPPVEMDSQGVCKACNVSPVAFGNSAPSLRASALGMCGKCYIKQHRRLVKKEDDARG